MTQNYRDLIAQRDVLNAKIEEARKQEVASALETIRGLVQQFGLQASDVFPSTRADGRSTRKGSAVAAKYRDPSSGATWTGRGKPPLWIKDKPRDDFLIIG